MTVPKMDANGNRTLDIKPVLIHIILFFAIDLERSSTNQCGDRLNKKSQMHHIILIDTFGFLSNQFISNKLASS
ncbi:hypothetical protein GLP37_13615 [Photobacterium phosphoreum]|uniref:hypothetical protein n=1 Tax=Photobacterium phosphoreum TaxID=659 RepID=UPI001E5E2474|nr:hypothetical protein [Photobacterium phosphoreum]MCD9503211.1 hypothetical protein [Photobacterium phosphoreum]